MDSVYISLPSKINHRAEKIWGKKQWKYKLQKSTQAKENLIWKLNFSPVRSRRKGFYKVGIYGAISNCKKIGKTSDQMLK